jgi:DNA-binding FadR family transcriptional regulator
MISDHHGFDRANADADRRRLTPLDQGPAGDSQDLARSILELVRERGLRVGDQLPTIRELAATLGVRPNLVRDALMRAQTMGVVKIVPRSGAFVQSLTFAPLVDALASTLLPALMQQDHNLFHLIDARRLLEVELIGRAACRSRLEELLPARQALESMSRLPPSGPREEYVKKDIRFHAEIARLAGNAVLFTVLEALLELLRPQLMQMPWSANRQERTDQSHTAIYEALVAGDAERARSEMHQHLSLAYEALLRDMQGPIVTGHSAATLLRPASEPTVAEMS